MNSTNSIQIFHQYLEVIVIYVDNQLTVAKLISNHLSESYVISPGIHNIQIKECSTNKLLYESKFILLEHQQIILFPLPNNECIAVLKNQEIPKNESVIQFFNLSNNFQSLHLFVTKGDSLFENIVSKEISEKLSIYTMIIDLEIRSKQIVIKKLPKVHFQPNYSYIILVDNFADVHVLEFN